jgi:hypothetical protein
MLSLLPGSPRRFLKGGGKHYISLNTIVQESDGGGKSRILHRPVEIPEIGKKGRPIPV